MSDIQIHTLPVLTDNYIHVVRDDLHGITIVIDPATADTTLKFLETKKWALTDILLTHHHGDHTNGVNELRAHFPTCHVYGYRGDEQRLPRLTHTVKDLDTLSIGSLDFEVIHLPGHTTGHIGYISRNSALAFTGDVLFGMGCGRVFEGTYAEMYESLGRLKALDPRTKIFCAHEYTANNGRFAQNQYPANDKIKTRLHSVKARRERGEFTVPLSLAEEQNTNPFLLAESLDEFSKLRDARNKW